MHSATIFSSKTILEIYNAILSINLPGYIHSQNIVKENLINYLNGCREKKILLSSALQILLNIKSAEFENIPLTMRTELCIAIKKGDELFYFNTEQLETFIIDLQAAELTWQQRKKINQLVEEAEVERHADHEIALQKLVDAIQIYSTHTDHLCTLKDIEHYYRILIFYYALLAEHAAFDNPFKATTYLTVAAKFHKRIGDHSTESELAYCNRLLAECYHLLAVIYQSSHSNIAMECFRIAMIFYKKIAANQFTENDKNHLNTASRTLAKNCLRQGELLSAIKVKQINETLKKATSLGAENIADLVLAYQLVFKYLANVSCAIDDIDYTTALRKLNEAKNIHRMIIHKINGFSLTDYGYHQDILNICAYFKNRLSNQPSLANPYNELILALNHFTTTLETDGQENHLEEIEEKPARPNSFHLFRLPPNSTPTPASKKNDFSF